MKHKRCNKMQWLQQCSSIESSRFTSFTVPNSTSSSQLATGIEKSWKCSHLSEQKNHILLPNQIITIINMWWLTKKWIRNTFHLLRQLKFTEFLKFSYFKGFFRSRNPLLFYIVDTSASPKTNIVATTATGNNRNEIRAPSHRLFESRTSAIHRHVPFPS